MTEATSGSDGPVLGGRRAVLVWGTAVAVYFLAIFHRSSLGVAGLAAAERFHITASQLSTFTVLQLLVYAAMQIPVGVLLDRFGPQRLLVAGAVFMTAAQLGFAFTGTYAGALLARVFVGMGDAMVFISVLRIIASWFPAFRSPILTAFTAMLGQCGALVAAIPLSRALASYGWTATFAASASLGILLGLLTVLVVRDVPPGSPPSRSVKDVRTVGRDLRLAWRDPGTRLGLWSHFTTQFASNVMGLLWGFPFFVHAEHCTDARGRCAADAAGRRLHRRRPGDRWVHQPPPLAALDGRPRDRRRDDAHLDGGAAAAGRRAAVAARAAGGHHRPRRPGLDDRLRPRADVRAGVSPRPGQRHRQRRRVHRVAAGGVRHRPGARRGDAGQLDRLQL